jgi:hypothetical protein
MLHRQPAAVDAHLGLEVCARIEPGGERAVDVSHRDRRILDRLGTGTVPAQTLNHRGQFVLVVCGHPYSCE